MKKLIVEKSIEINAPASKVWEVLTNPELTKQYMFGCEVISDWKVGSPIVWKCSMEGKEVVFVKGNIVKIKPEKFLEFSTFDPNMGIEDIPSNYLVARYEMTQEKGHTQLTVTQGDFAKVANAEKRYNDTVSGWSSTLPKIKELAEKD